MDTMDKFNYEDLETLICPLPEDIVKRKYGGDFEGAVRLCDQAIAAKETSEYMKRRLCLEKRILERLPAEYPYTFEEIEGRVREILPDVTREELRRWQDEGQLDWIYVKGQERFAGRVVSNLMNNAELAKRSALLLGKADEKGNAPLSAGAVNCEKSRQKMMKDGVDSHHFRIRETMTISDRAFHPGKIKVYLPVPAQCAQLSDIKIEAASPVPYHLSDPAAPQRTICFEEDMKENHPFFVEFSFTSTGYYHDFWSEKDGGTMSLMYRNRPKEDDPVPEDLEEHYPHIRFTAFLRQLCAQLSEGCRTPMEKAKSFYNYLTTQAHYSYVSPYFLIEDQAEYYTMNRHGDCGLYSLAMINLCRIAGIPARWQSGNSICGDFGGCHDWCQIYLEPYGWIGCDPSYGGDSTETKRRFYFGNLDPLRMPSTRAFQQPFDPPMEYLRADPYDNQSGEAEYEDGSLSGCDFDTGKKILENTTL